jgi:HAD superfamily hydrolase (TIGR01459 family)
MIEPTFCSGLADIASRYQGFIVDQWGVLHDGEAAYPGAIATLERLRAEGRRVVLLSNSGRLVAVNLGRLRAMGFADDLVEGVFTSGEATWRALRDRPDPFFAALGERCLLWAQDADHEILDGLPLIVVEDVDAADFILLAGTDPAGSLETFKPALARALARDLPMVCANPDVVVVGPDGMGMAPGAIARHYQSLGGRVAFAGKPHPPIYRLCLETLAPIPPARILAIGDSLEHDIAGGAAMGLDTALVMGGIHAEAFDLERGRSANWPALERLAHSHGALPRWVLPRFRWSAAGSPARPEAAEDQGGSRRRP